MAIVALKAASNLCSLADYKSAAAALGGDWPGIGKRPQRHGLGNEDYARLLMVCAVLSIKLGNINQVSVQHAAKDMLTESVRLFGDLPDAQEAQMWLGVIYYLCGEFNEAITVSDTLLETDTNADVVFATTLTKALAVLALGKPSAALELIASVEMLVEIMPALLQGKFYLNRGLAYRALSNFEEAANNYRQAADLFEEANAPGWEAATITNMVRVFAELGQYTEAHTFAERAISLFQKLKDKAGEAKSWDEDARTYLKQENYAQAERHAYKAVLLLTDGDNLAWRAEALITHGTAMAQSGYQKGLVQLEEAARLSEHVGSFAQADEAYQEMWKATRGARKVATSVNESVKPVERVVIQRVLDKHSWSILPAANELGLFRNALLKKIKQFGLSRSAKSRKRKEH